MNSFQLRIKLDANVYELRGAYAKLPTARRHQALLQAELKPGSKLRVDVTEFVNGMYRVVKESK